MNPLPAHRRSGGSRHVIRRSDHVVVHVQRDAIELGLAQFPHVCGRADEPRLLRTPPRDRRVFSGLTFAIITRCFEQRGRARPVVVDPGPFLYRVEELDGRNDENVVMAGGGGSFASLGAARRLRSSTRAISRPATRSRTTATTRSRSTAT